MDDCIPAECIEFIDGDMGICDCGNNMVERDDFREMVPPASAKAAGGANPVVCIGGGRTRPEPSSRAPSRESAASAIDDCDDMGCKRCEVVDGLDSVVVVMYDGCGWGYPGS